MYVQSGENLHPLTRIHNRSSCTDSSPRRQSRGILMRNPPTRPETCVAAPSGPQYCRCQRYRRWCARRCPSWSPASGQKTITVVPTHVTQLIRRLHTDGENCDTVTDLRVSIQHFDCLGGDKEVDLGHHLRLFLLTL